MKRLGSFSFMALLLALPGAAQQIPVNFAQSPPPGPHLRLEWRGNAPDLVVDSLSSTGALFLLCAADLSALADSPAVMIATNTPLANDLRLPLGSSGTLSNQAFYSAVHFTNLVFIPAGTFVMGSPESELCRNGNEGPQTTVTLSRGFCAGRYEVTQGEYLAVMGTNPSRFNGGSYGTNLNWPVEQVSWHDATNFCYQLTLRERAAGRLPAEWEHRLPTEAQWEYACRAGTITPFHYGPALLSGMANFIGLYEYGCTGDPCYCYNSRGIYLGRTTSVGSYGPNAWGLYDMHGNVWEWCQDWYGDYPGGSMTDPQGPAMGSSRAYRGGSWRTIASGCKSAIRLQDYPTTAYDIVGFRVALVSVP